MHQVGKEHVLTGRAHKLFQESEAATQLQALGTSGTLKLNSLVKMLLVIITNLLLLDDRWSFLCLQQEAAALGRDRGGLRWPRLRRGQPGQRHHQMAVCACGLLAHLPTLDVRHLQHCPGGQGVCLSKYWAFQGKFGDTVGDVHKSFSKYYRFL